MMIGLSIDRSRMIGGILASVKQEIPYLPSAFTDRCLVMIVGYFAFSARMEDRQPGDARLRKAAITELSYHWLCNE